MRYLDLYLLVWLSLLASVASADVLRGKVVKVTDGDTVTVLDADKIQHKIRLNGIDAPESKQAFGTKSRQHLAEMIHEKTVRVEWTKRDRYGRILGEVFCDNQPVNLLMVRDGMPWHFKRYDTSKGLVGAESRSGSSHLATSTSTRWRLTTWLSCKIGIAGPKPIVPSGH